MLPLEHADRIQITFDDRRLVANAGLILPATGALHLGLPQLVDRHLLDCPNWLTGTLTWAAPQAEPTPATRL